jgi:excisionase family DNA binding protein
MMPPFIASAQSHDCSQSSKPFTIGIGRTALYELIAAGKIKTVKIGRRRFVPSEAIDEFVAGLAAA